MIVKVALAFGVGVVWLQQYSNLPDRLWVLGLLPALICGNFLDKTAFAGGCLLWVFMGFVMGASASRHGGADRADWARYLC